MADVILKKGEGRTLNQGGMWVFDNEIDHIEGNYISGDMVKIYAFNHYPLGVGFINDHSKIRIRLMSRDVNAVIDRDFLRRRVKDAWSYRKRCVDTSSCRLIFGEADFLPGLVIDKYENVLVVESLALGIDRLKETIVALVKEELLLDGIEITGVYERSDAKVREQEGLERYKGFIGEPFDTKVIICENGVQYEVDVENGQKTGFFLDQKYNRLAVQKMAQGLEVLDCFTHTGSFALNAGLGKAKKVLGVDASELACEQARKNALLNHLEDIVSFECHDVFELLPALQKEGRMFDMVILDPPAFTKSRQSVKNASRGYREINLRAMKLIKDGGYLATCSCSHFMSEELFAKNIALAAKDAHKRLRQIEFKTQAPDHPILWSADESYYLKFYIFQVIDDK